MLMTTERAPETSMTGETELRFEEVGAREPECAHIRFTGRFQGIEVVWDATVLTLGRWSRQIDQAPGTDSGGARRPLRAFLHVGHVTRPNAIVPIAVALPVTTVDDPTLFKTIIMVRRYKGLRAGRHEYGPSYSWPL
jgi:hypothetical protein